MFTYIKRISVIFIVLLLTGCLYPKSELTKNEAPNEDQLEIVQTALEKYQEKTGGLMPIKTKPSDTSMFEKYLIDFNILKEKNIISDIPGNAYENGGIYQYTLITPEEDPRVRLIDLRVTEAIRKVSVKLDIYRSKNTYPPFGDEIEKGIYTIDYKELGFSNEQYVVSPYSNKNLPIIMDVDGQLYVDYRIDLTDALETYDHDYKEGEDIRWILADNTPFAPAYSLPYTILDGEPNFILK